MRLVAILLLCLPAWAQVQIHYSRQADEITRALVGTVPKGVALYRADVVNVGTTEARFFPSRVAFEAAATAPVQDPEAALFAAQNYRDTRWWVVSLNILKEGAKYAGPAALGLSTAGVAVPAIVTGLAGGIGGSAAVLEGFRKEASRLNVPATFLRDGLPEIILKPGEPVPYLLVLGGNPAQTFTAGVDDIPSAPQPLQPASVPKTTLEMLCGQNWENCSTGVVERISLSTHPQIEEPYTTERIAAMIQERSRQIGAVE